MSSSSPRFPILNIAGEQQWYLRYQTTKQYNFSPTHLARKKLTYGIDQMTVGSSVSSQGSCILCLGFAWLIVDTGLGAVQSHTKTHYMALGQSIHALTIPMRPSSTPLNFSSVHDCYKLSVLSCSMLIVCIVHSIYPFNQFTRLHYLFD